MKSLDVQHGGDHYKTLKIQPVSFIHANSIGFLEGSAIKYLSRWKTKHKDPAKQLEDLNKAKHFIQLLIELEFPDSLLEEPPELKYDAKFYGGLKSETIKELPPGDIECVTKAPKLPAMPMGKNFQVDIERMELLRPYITKINGWSNFFNFVKINVR